MNKYYVIGYLKRTRKIYESEKQECDSLLDAIRLYKEWKKNRKYKSVFVSRIIS